VHELLIQKRSADGIPFPPFLTGISVLEAFLFRPDQGLLFHQQALPFIVLSGSAPLQDHCREPGMLARPPGQGCISGGKEDKVFHIPALQTQRPLLGIKGDPCLGAEVSAATVAPGVSMDDKNLQRLILHRTNILLHYGN
jgi:hypothetical protein